MLPDTPWFFTRLDDLLKAHHVERATVRFGGGGPTTTLICGDAGVALLCAPTTSEKRD
jgi:hypothetical protein